MLKIILSRKNFMIIIFFSLTTIPFSYSRPIDFRASNALKDMEKIWEIPISQRKLSENQEIKFMKMTEYNNTDMKTCSALALAFAEDSNSLHFLDNLSLDKNVRVKGAASYALKIRHISGRDPNEILRNLCFFLGKSDNQTEKIFLANRMWVDFKEKAIYTILDSIKSEPNDIYNFYRCDLFYYLSQSDDPEILKEALKLDWRQDVLVSLPENLAYIMGSITPGRRKDQMENSVLFITKNIQNKLENK